MHEEVSPLLALISTEEQFKSFKLLKSHTHDDNRTIEMSNLWTFMKHNALHFKFCQILSWGAYFSITDLYPK